MIVNITFGLWLLMATETIQWYKTRGQTKKIAYRRIVSFVNKNKKWFLRERATDHLELGFKSDVALHIHDERLFPLSYLSRHVVTKRSY